MNLFRTKSIEQSMSDADEPGRKLKRSLSSWDLMIMGVAVAVGAGIFSVGAKAAANFAGPAVTLSFAIAAVTCALAIMCYAEFATAIPVAGSAYVFTYATMGELLAWIIGWNLILELFTAGAVIAKYWGIYLSKVFALMGVDIPPSISLGGVDLYWGAFLIVAVFTVLLVLGTKLSARVGNIFTLVKIGVVLFVIVVGFTYVKFENYAPFVPTSEPTGGTGAADVMKQSFFAFLTGAAPAQYGTLGIFAGAALVFFAFIGFDVVATSAEEVKDPQKTLPRGIFGGLAVVTVLYILVSLALTGMVSYTQLAEAENPTLTTAFEAVGNTDAAKIIAFGSLVGLTTVIMVLLMGLSRVVLAMSRDGLLPRSLSKTSTIRATPVRLQIICGAAVALVAGLTNVDLLEEMINIGTLSAFVTVSIGVLVLRKKRPDLKPAFRVPFGKVLPIVSAVLCLYLMTNLAVETWIFFAIWLVIGVVIYFSYGQRHSRLNEKFAEAKASVNGPGDKSAANGAGTGRADAEADADAAPEPGAAAPSWQPVRIEVAGAVRIRWKLPANSHGSGDFGVGRRIGFGARSGRAPYDGLMARPARPERKAELLAAILDYLMDKTLAELTFRSLADGLGVSSYVLVYHFGHREQLVNEIIRTIESRLDSIRATDVRDIDRDAWRAFLLESWRWTMAQRNRHLARLEFEATAQDIVAAVTPRNSAGAFQDAARKGPGLADAPGHPGGVRRHRRPPVHRRLLRAPVRLRREQPARGSQQGL